MGTVYLAEQKEPVRRRAAVKVIKLGMDSKAVLTRFDAERRALAMMEHSCIATVFDAGLTPQGQPYFAMEYVKGIPITDYCDQNKLTLKERIELVQQLCSGVQHAHLKGVMHRDLKPNNVLVTVQDGKPLPKIIDFGLAKATDHHLVEATLFTEQGQVIGTPEYMSPEQAGLGGLDVDTRTDVYSLGVLLYQLLVGELPFTRNALREAGYLEMQRIIREQEPEKPSTRVTTIGDKASEHAISRRVDVGELKKRLRGDLDWIVLKTLEKDRTRRYETPLELAADLERHLQHEPVLASPPSVSYRLRKMVRKHRGQVIAAAVVLMALVTGAVATFLQYLRAEDHAAQAIEQRNLAVQAKSEAERASADSQFEAYAANVATAYAAVRAGDPRLARRRLEACPERLRAWEWRYLMCRSDPGLRTWGDGGGAKCLGAPIAVSPDGKLLAAQRYPTSLVLIDLASGREIHEFVWPCPVDATKGRVSPVCYGVTFSPDSTLVAAHVGIDQNTVGPDGVTTVRTTHHVVAAWHVASRSSRLQLVSDQSPGILSAPVRFTHDGSSVVYSTLGGVAASLVGEPARPPRVLVENEPDLSSWTLSSDGRSLVVGYQDGRLRSMSMEDLRFGDWRDSGSGEPMVALACSADQQWLAAASGSTVWLWREQDARRPSPLFGHEAGVTGLAFSSDNKLLASTSRDHAVRVWEVASGRPLTTFSHAEVAWGAAFHPDGSRLFSAENYTVKEWGTGGAEQGLRFETNQGPITSLCISPDASWLATSSIYGTLAIWRTGTSYLEAMQHGLRTVKVRFDPTGRVLYSCGEDGHIRLWSVPALEPIHAVTVSAKPVLDIDLSSDGRALAWLSLDGRVGTWNTASRAAQLARQVFPEGRYSHHCLDSVTFSPDGGRLGIGCTWDPSIHTLELSSGQLSTHTLDGSSYVGQGAVVFSTDGRGLFSSHGSLRLFETKSWRSMWTVQHPSQGDIVLVPGEPRLLFTPGEGMIALCETDAGRRVFELHLGNDTVSALAVSPAADLIAVGMWGGGIVILSTGRSVPEIEAERRLVRTARDTLSRLRKRNATSIDLIDAIRAEPDMSKEAREYAVREASFHGDDPHTLNNLAWRIVRRPGAGEVEVRRALQLAGLAVAADPHSAAVLNTFGAAQYRAGQYSDAMATVEKCLQINGPARVTPEDLAFLAMAQWQLGRTNEARATLARLDVLVGEAGGDSDASMLAREARVLIGSR